MNDAQSFLNMHGCKVKDENGVHLADLFEDGGQIVVSRTPACSAGDYFYILGYIRDLGFDVR